MQRLVSLMVVLAHLGVATVPCAEAATTAAKRTVIGGRASHHLPASPGAEGAHTGGHASTAREHPAEHAHAQHGGASPQAAEGHAPHDAEATPRVRGDQPELRAPCLCGCSKRSNSPGTTTPQPPSFAPPAPDPPRLVIAIPPVGEAAPAPWPISPADVIDHVPIVS